jgi:ribosomal protein L39E
MALFPVQLNAGVGSPTVARGGAWHVKEIITNKTLAFWAILATLGFGCPVQAQEGHPGQVIEVESRGVKVPVFAVWRADAVASVVLYSGGGGGFGQIAEDGWPSSGNFLIRTGKLWASHPFNVVMVGRPADIPDLDGPVRTGEQHAQDNLEMFRAIKENSQAPIWIIGSSMGTISATAAAIQDKHHLVSGVVLTSSVTSYRIPGAVRRQDLAKIRVPVFVVHHEKDACKVCTPHEAKDIADDLKNAPIKKTLLVSGGSGAIGNPCGAQHWHGFIGMEKEVIDLIAAWIKNPTN